MEFGCNAYFVNNSRNNYGYCSFEADFKPRFRGKIRLDYKSALCGGLN
jgi:hypothetical protein